MNTTEKPILIVDDAVTVRMFHKQILSPLGYRIDEAENGIEALEKSLSLDYGLFLVDINMPKMDGYRFLREVRQAPSLWHIPAIMISTEAESQDELKAYEAGANFYFVKPVDAEKMSTLVRIMMEGD